MKNQTIFFGPRKYLCAGSLYTRIYYCSIQYSYTVCASEARVCGVGGQGGSGAFHPKKNIVFSMIQF